MKGFARNRDSNEAEIVAALLAAVFLHRFIYNAAGLGSDVFAYIGAVAPAKLWPPGKAKASDSVCRRPSRGATSPPIVSHRSRDAEVKNSVTTEPTAIGNVSR